MTQASAHSWHSGKGAWELLVDHPRDGDLCNVAQRKVLPLWDHFKVSLVQRDHSRAMANGYDRRLRQPSGQHGIEVRLQLFLDGGC